MNSGYNPQNDPFSSTTHLPMVSDASVETRLNFIRKTYVLFLMGILTAVAAGVVCLSVPAVNGAVFGLLRSSPIILFLLIIGASIGAQAVSRIEGLNYVALFGFTGLMGLLFAPIVALYAPTVVGQAAFLTVAIFGALTAYAFISRKDFSYLGGMLFIGVISLVLGGLANAFFFKSGIASYMMAWVTVLIFSGYVLYDTSQIIHRYDERGYCSAALSLFLDFLNIFMALLRILSGGNRN
jgi:FtsH-binding integral membrane protein